jgi:amidase
MEVYPMKPAQKLAISLLSLCVALPTLSVAQGKFAIEEATIEQMQGAIQSGASTCKGLVEAHIERVKAYNGMCTALVTKDGKSIPTTKGYVRGGAPILFPVKTVPITDVVPDFDQYQGLPIEFGRMEPTISDPSVMAQYGMRVGIPNAGQVNAIETLNLRGERSVTCKAKCDAHPSKGALPKSCPAVCEDFRKYPDALERAAELDAEYGTKPDLAALPMYCVPFSLKNWYDAKDMRATGGNDVNFAMDAPKFDSPDVGDLREKGGIIMAVATASSTGLTAQGPNKPTMYIPNGNFQDAAWAGQACNPYDTSRVPRGTSNGSGVSVATSMVACSICEQSSASCKGPASRNNVVNFLATKGVMMDGGLGYSDSGDRAGIHCRTVADAAKVMDAVKGYETADMFTAIPASIIPKEPYASFVIGEQAIPSKPLKGMRIGVVREFMVKHVKNDEAISDQIDSEIKTVLRDKLGAELLESVDPLYTDDASVPNMKYTFTDAFSEVLPQNAPEYFWQKTDSGELEFAVPGWDVTSPEYAVALATGKAPLSPKINLRRISSDLGDPKGLMTVNTYLAKRGDARVKDWASWVANHKAKNEQQRVGSANAALIRDLRADADAPSYMKMQSVLRMVIHRVMYENNIDAFVNPEQTTPPYKLGGAGEPEVNNRGTNSCCQAFTALIGGPEIDVPAGYTEVVYNPQYKLTPDKTRYIAVTGTVKEKLEHPMPISMMVWGAPATEPALIKIASAFEAATHHRKPPPDFPALDSARKMTKR